MPTAGPRKGRASTRRGQRHTSQQGAADRRRRTETNHPGPCRQAGTAAQCNEKCWTLTTLKMRERTEDFFFISVAVITGLSSMPENGLPKTACERRLYGQMGRPLYSH